MSLLPDSKTMKVDIKEITHDNINVTEFKKLGKGQMAFFNKDDVKRKMSLVFKGGELVKIYKNADENDQITSSSLLMTYNDPDVIKGVYNLECVMRKKHGSNNMRSKFSSELWAMNEDERLSNLPTTLDMQFKLSKVMKEDSDRDGKFLRAMFLDENGDELDFKFDDIESNIPLYSNIDIITNMNGYNMSGMIGIVFKPMYLKVYPADDDEDEDVFASFDKRSSDEDNTSSKKQKL